MWCTKTIILGLVWLHVTYIVYCNLQMDLGLFKFPDIKFNRCEESGEIY